MFLNTLTNQKEAKYVIDNIDTTQVSTYPTELLKKNLQLYIQGSFLNEIGQIMPLNELESLYKLQKSKKTGSDEIEQFADQDASLYIQEMMKVNIFQNYIKQTDLPIKHLELCHLMGPLSKDECYCQLSYKNDTSCEVILGRFLRSWAEYDMNDLDKFTQEKSLNLYSTIEQFIEQVKEINEQKKQIYELRKLSNEYPNNQNKLQEFVQGGLLFKEDDQEIKEVLTDDSERQQFLNLMGLLKDILCISKENDNRYNFTCDSLLLVSKILRQFRENEGKPALYLLDSPTGTGKTRSYYLAQYLTHILTTPKISNYVNPKLKTLIFTNTQIITNQVVIGIKKHINDQIDQKTKPIKYGGEIITCMEIIARENETVCYIKKAQMNNSGKDVEFQTILAICTGKLTDIEKDVLLDNCIVIQNALPELKAVYIANNRYVYTNKIHGRNKDNKEININVEILRQGEFFGDIMILPLYNYQFLNMFGIIDHYTHIQSVVYDELDVFYQKKSIEQFHKFFFSQLYNLTAKTIIFASATLNNEFLEHFDYNISQKYQLQIEAQITAKMLSSKITTVFPIVFTQNNKYTITSLGHLEQIVKYLWQIGNTYIYFDIEQNLSSYIVFKQDIITIKTPLFFRQFKGKFKDLVSYVAKFKKLYVTDVILKNHHFRSILDHTYIRPIYPISEIKGIKLLNQYHDQEMIVTYEQFYDEEKNEYESETVVETMLYYGIYQLNLKDAKNYLKSTKMGDQTWGDKQTSVDHWTNLVKNTEHRLKFNEKRILQDQQNFKMLVITFDDEYTMNIIKNKYNQYKQFSANQGDIPSFIYDSFKYTKYPKFNIKTPFNVQRMNDIGDQVQDQSNQDKCLLYDDFKKIGRGVDIDGLTMIYLIIPLYFKHDIIGLDFSEFKQCIGRVGRFAKLGEIKLSLVKLYEEEFEDIKNPDNQLKQEVIDRKQQIESGMFTLIDNLTFEQIEEEQEKNYQTIMKWVTELGLQQTSEKLAEISTSGIAQLRDMY